MLAAASIGSGLSTPGWCSSRRRIRRLSRASWRWTLAFTRKPPGGEPARVVNHLDCSLKPGGFRVSLLQRVWGYAWLRARRGAGGGVADDPLARRQPGLAAGPVRGLAVLAGDVRRPAPHR